MQNTGHNVVFLRESVGEKNGQIVIGIRYYTRKELKIACSNNILLHMGIIPVHVVLEFTSVMLNVQPTLLGHLRTCAEKSMINRYRVTVQRVEAQKHIFDPAAIRIEERLQNRVADRSNDWVTRGKT